METRTQLNPLVACFLIVLLGALVMAAQASPIITEFPIPSVPGSPLGIAEGPDGNMWFTEQLPNKIGRITPDGRITEYPIPTPNSSPYLITKGPDFALWFTEYATSKIGRIIAQGHGVSEFALPANSNPIGIAVSDDDIWFTEYGSNKIGRMTRHGALREFSIPTPNSPSPLRLPVVTMGICGSQNSAATRSAELIRTAR